MIPAIKFEENLLAIEHQKQKTLKDLEALNFDYIKQQIEHAIFKGKTEFKADWKIGVADWETGMTSFSTSDFPTEKIKKEILHILNELGYWVYCRKYRHREYNTYAWEYEYAYFTMFYWTHKKPNWLSQWWFNWQPPTKF